MDLVNDGAPLSRAALAACGLAKTSLPHANHYDLVGDGPGGASGGSASESAFQGGEVQPDLLPWVGWKDGGDYTPTQTLKVHANDKRIVKVGYRAGNYALGTSTDVAGDFPIRYTFLGPGDRTLTAIGLDAIGKEIAVNNIDVTFMN